MEVRCSPLDLLRRRILWIPSADDKPDVWVEDKGFLRFFEPRLDFELPELRDASEAIDREDDWIDG